MNQYKKLLKLMPLKLLKLRLNQFKRQLKLKLLKLNQLRKPHKLKLLRLNQLLKLLLLNQLLLHKQLQHKPLWMLLRLQIQLLKQHKLLLRPALHQERCPFKLQDFKQLKCSNKWTKLSQLLTKKEHSNKSNSRCNNNPMIQLVNFKD